MHNPKPFCNCQAAVFQGIRSGTSALGFLGIGSLKTQGRTWAGPGWGRRGRMLTLGCASQYGRMPLFVATKLGFLDIGRVLLEAGADITAKDNVSERRVGGEGQRIRASRDLGRF